MWKSVIGLVLLTLAVVSAPAHSKSVVYNGIECAAPTARQLGTNHCGSVRTR